MKFITHRCRRLARLARKGYLWFQIRVRGMQTTKVCPKCFDECMVPLRSINLKICPSCQHEIPWQLGHDQQSTLQPSRATRKGTFA